MVSERAQKLGVLLYCLFRPLLSFPSFFFIHISLGGFGHHKAGENLSVTRVSSGVHRSVVQGSPSVPGGRLQGQRAFRPRGHFA